MASMNTQGVIISRGAEAEIYLIDFFGVKAVLKRRVSKGYRVPLYDELFIRNRTRIEAKILVDLYMAGLPVPAVLFVDEEKGILIVEYIEGKKASEVFSQLGENEALLVARKIGEIAGRMHSLGIYHGDYTLANILLSEKVYVIDFGLSGYSNDIEEYAIDLHLMSRSINAGLADPEYAKVLVSAMLEEYKRHFKGNGGEVIERMREISVRGRYIDRELRKSIMRERYAT